MSTWMRRKNLIKAKRLFKQDNREAIDATDLSKQNLLLNQLQKSLNLTLMNN
jgi:hypothetical protein